MTLPEAVSRLESLAKLHDTFVRINDEDVSALSGAIVIMRQIVVAKNTGRSFVMTFEPRKIVPTPQIEEPKCD